MKRGDGGDAASNPTRTESFAIVGSAVCQIAALSALPRREALSSTELADEIAGRVVEKL